jgi:hypothetical protein
MFFLLLLMFSLQGNWRISRFCLEARGVGRGDGGDREKGESMAQTMYTYMNN